MVSAIDWRIADEKLAGGGALLPVGRDRESVAGTVGVAIGVSVGVPGHHRRRRYMR